MHMVGRGLLKEHFCKTFVKISAVRQKQMPISTCPITLSCHSNTITQATIIKNTDYVEANVMNISAKFHFHPPDGSEKKNFDIF